MISPNMFGSVPPTTNKALAATALRDASLDDDPTKSSLGVKHLLKRLVRPPEPLSRALFFLGGRDEMRAAKAPKRHRFDTVGCDSV